MMCVNVLLLTGAEKGTLIRIYIYIYICVGLYVVPSRGCNNMFQLVRKDKEYKTM